MLFFRYPYETTTQIFKALQASYLARFFVLYQIFRNPLKYLKKPLYLQPRHFFNFTNNFTNTFIFRGFGMLFGLFQTFIISSHIIVFTNVKKSATPPRNVSYTPINMMSFYYWFREGKTKDLGTIYCEIRVDGEKSVPISTKIKLNRKQWNPKEQCFQGKEAAKNQKLMDNHQLRFTQIFNQIGFEKPNEPIRPDEILERHRVANGLVRKGKRVPFFIDVFKEFIKDQYLLVKAEKLKKQSVVSRESKFQTIRTYLVQKQLEQIDIDEIDHVFMEDFKFYLKISKYQESTIEKYLFLIKGIIKYSVSKGYTQDRKIESYKVEKAKEKDPVSLTQEEMDKVDALDLSDKHRKTFDIYRFCAETSLSFIDYNTLTEDDIVIDSDETVWIKLGRDKTDTRQRVPLNEKAMSIFKRYGSDIYTLPKLSNTKLNKYIKEIAKKAKINKYLTFHTSRKSFVDHSINELDIPESTIQAMVGWKDSRQLSRYARVKDSTIKKQFLK